jgi:hypothetical protein
MIDSMIEGSVVKRANYRKLAFGHYAQDGQVVCAHCGFGIRDVLEAAHLDGIRSHNDLENLAILCPNCHKMHDLDLITTETIVQMRDRPKRVIWAKRMKDAGPKAAETRRKTAEKAKWRKAGLKAAETRKKNSAAPNGTTICSPIMTDSLPTEELA